MPRNLKRYYGLGDLHFVTFSCYRRLPLLGCARRRDLFLHLLEKVRVKYELVVVGYVVMPEHRGPQHARFWRDGVAMSTCW